MGDKEMDKLDKELQPLTPEQRSRDFQTRAFGFVTGMVIFIGIWGLTGAGYFWPGWVLLFGGIDIARRAYTTYVNPPDAIEPSDAIDESDDPEELAP